MTSVFIAIRNAIGCLCDFVLFAVICGISVALAVLVPQIPDISKALKTVDPNVQIFTFAFLVLCGLLVAYNTKYRERFASLAIGIVGLQIIDANAHTNLGILSRIQNNEQQSFVLYALVALALLLVLSNWRKI